MLGKGYGNTLIIATMLISLITVLAASGRGKNLACPTASCEAVQESSFGEALGVPLGAYAAALLSLVLFLRLVGKERIAALILWGMLGTEAYLTFIAFGYIGTLCVICLLFLFALGCCVALSSQAQRVPAGALCAALTFFGAHFLFFYPDAQLKPTLVSDPGAPVQVEVFAAPSCTHCEEALSSLREISQGGEVRLIVRPVSLGERATAVDWVERELFARRSGTARRMAEKVVWENERQARSLAGGRLIVPIIRVGQDGEELVFCGWNEQVKQYLASSLRGISLVRAGTESMNGDTCSTGANCGGPHPLWGQIPSKRAGIN